ncbi:uncharacterized protein LOC135471223 isoform X2 [Liolophura sinensis]|uniref:uncharacterized protein LOC135471223 isoform X2 n=1 Tax=Liolophura sinensis TaxID=3198878 RepID=UPI0031586A77
MTAVPERLELNSGNTTTPNTGSSSTSGKVEPTVTKSGAITVLVTDVNHTASNIGPALLRRQPSTESRDNPFIPDGELSKETDELLKRATIVRDKFYLDQQERKAKGLDSTDNVNVEKSPVQESVVAPVSAQPAHAHAKSSQPACAEVKPRMRENGRVEDSVSPEGIKADIDKGAAEPVVDGSKTPAESPGDNGKEKKKQKKCCSIM